MTKFIRTALAVCAGLAMAAGGATTAYASAGAPDPATPPAETVVQLQRADGDMCLDLRGSSPDNGVKAIQWACDGSSTQQWRMVPVGDFSYELRSVNSGKCLEVENSGTKAGADVQQWACSGGKQMRWHIDLVDHARKLYELRPTHTEGRCLDIDSGERSHVNGVRAQAWYCNQSVAQLWQIKVVK
ncbi:RICIN domain-containing protein [Streptomyces cinnamoneus]